VYQQRNGGGNRGEVVVLLTNQWSFIV
jgi:hypothetical protein